LRIFKIGMVLNAKRVNIMIFKINIFFVCYLSSEVSQLINIQNLCTEVE